MTEKNTTSKFEKTVTLRIGSRSFCIETVDEAWSCLQEHFPNKSGQSYRRALHASEAFLADEGSVEAAQSTLVVAAMEAGISFEVHESEMSRMERQLAQATELSVWNMLHESTALSTEAPSQSEHAETEIDVALRKLLPG